MFQKLKDNDTLKNLGFKKIAKGKSTTKTTSTSSSKGSKSTSSASSSAKSTSSTKSTISKKSTTAKTESTTTKSNPVSTAVAAARKKVRALSNYGIKRWSKSRYLENRSTSIASSPGPVAGGYIASTLRETPRGRRSDEIYAMKKDMTQSEFDRYNRQASGDQIPHTYDSPLDQSRYEEAVQRVRSQYPTGLDA